MKISTVICAAAACAVIACACGCGPSSGTPTPIAPEPQLVAQAPASSYAVGAVYQNVNDPQGFVELVGQNQNGYVLVIRINGNQLRLDGENAIDQRQLDAFMPAGDWIRYDQPLTDAK